MNRANAYREDVNTAVRYFRPILSKLNIRDKEKQKTVYLADFDHLDFLNLDYFTVTVLVADMKSSSGLFFTRQTEDLTDCYIVINSNLYNNPNFLEKAKIVGVHEFCHFIAVIYSLSATTIDHQREVLCKRLSEKIDELNTDTINKFYIELYKSERDDIHISEFNDEHFRLGLEGKTVDYDVLFKHFLLSKELFEEYFNAEKQKEFHSLISSPENELIHKGFKLFIDVIDVVSKEKSIPRNFAFKQALSWVKGYLR